MGQRLVATVRTPDAVEYQLHRHPLGPVSLANALVSESNGTEIEDPVGSVTVSKIGRARVIFSLMEIALMIAHAGKHLHRQKQAGEADHRAVFRRATRKVLQQVDAIVQSDVTVRKTDVRVAESLGKYRHAIEQEAAKLLAGLEDGEPPSCQ